MGLTPVYWECMEPEEGSFDFTMVDGVIRQAREEKVGLILLWFGLWKNGGSAYVPAWMKTDEHYFYMRGQDGRLLESVAPFCEEAVEKDAKAFRTLMEHLKEEDQERTVIMVQVENEDGVWGHPRDYSSAAEKRFRESIPEEIGSLFQTEGTWEEVFGNRASEYFMAWAFAKAVGRISAEGKALYPLPMFMNCVPLPGWGFLNWREDSRAEVRFPVSTVFLGSWRRRLNCTGLIFTARISGRSVINSLRLTPSSFRKREAERTVPPRHCFRWPLMIPSASAPSALML